LWNGRRALGVARTRAGGRVAGRLILSPCRLSAANSPAAAGPALSGGRGCLIGNQPIKDKHPLRREAGDVPNPDILIDRKPFQDFEDLYAQEGIVKQKVALNQLLDPSFLQRAAEAAK